MAGDDLAEPFAGMGHEGDAPVTAAACQIISLAHYQVWYSGVLPFLRYAACISDGGDGVVETLQCGVVTVVVVVFGGLQRFVREFVRTNRLFFILSSTTLPPPSRPSKVQSPMPYLGGIP